MPYSGQMCESSVIGEYNSMPSPKRIGSWIYLTHTVIEGSLGDCSTELCSNIEKGSVAPVKKEVVVVLHGLGESRGAMQPLVSFLEENMTASILTFGYASPQAPLASHAHSLGRVLAGLPPTTSINFVGHSMGNLVVRRWLQDAQP